ncbi:MAG: aminotransferase class I/II-fold pyridoxal phosphate-dependent enzyme, partial [Promethearchaeota archaeon]
PAVIPALTSGIYFCIQLFLDPGQVVALPNKRWGNYDLVITTNLGVGVETYEFFEGQAFNQAAFKRALENCAVRQGKVVTILNFPNNPTGYVPTPSEKDAIVDTLGTVASETGKPIVVILDDAYEGFVYDDGRESASLFGELVNFHELVVPVKVDGLSKEFLAYGARVGALTLGLNDGWFGAGERDAFLAEWENKLSGLLRSSVSNSNRVFQEVAADLIEGEADAVKEQKARVVSILKERCVALNEGLAKHGETLKEAGVTVDPNAGGFFLFLNLPPKIPAAKFAGFLLESYKVGTIPVEKPATGVNGIRIAYCSIESRDIPSMVDRVVEALGKFEA